MSTTPTCKTCGGTTGHRVPSVLDPEGIGDPGHKVEATPISGSSPNPDWDKPTTAIRLNLPKLDTQGTPMVMPTSEDKLLERVIVAAMERGNLYDGYVASAEFNAEAVKVVAELLPVLQAREHRLMAEARINENALWHLRAMSIKSKSIMAISFLDRNSGLEDPDIRFSEYFFRDERIQLESKHGHKQFATLDTELAKTGPQLNIAEEK